MTRFLGGWKNETRKFLGSMCIIMARFAARWKNGGGEKFVGSTHIIMTSFEVG